MLLPAAFLFPATALSASALAWGAGAGIATVAGLGLLYGALAIGRMSVVTPITATLGIVLPVLDGLLIGERLGTLALLGIGLALVAVVMLGQEGPSGAAAGDGKRALAMALGSGVAFATFYLCLKHAGPEAELWTLVAARGAAVALLLAMALPRGDGVLPGRVALPATVAGAIDAAANVLALLAIQGGLMGVVAPLISLYPASTLILARLVLGERLRPVQGAGLAAAAAAVILIAQ